MIKELAGHVPDELGLSRRLLDIEGPGVSQEMWQRQTQRQISECLLTMWRVVEGTGKDKSA